MARPTQAHVTTPEDREAKVQGLIARMSEGVARAIANPEGWRAALRRQARFHSYSFGNQMLIAVQRGDATRVAGYQAWRAAGRQVRKGEKGIGILAPMVVRKREADAAGVETERRVVVGFRVEHVFDIAQTDSVPGKAQDEPDPIGIAADMVFGDLKRYAEGQGLTVRVACAGGNGVRGYYEPATRSIVVDPGNEGAWAAKVLAHEIAHSILHPDGYSAGADPRPRELAELEAESAAYVVVAALGLETEALEWYSFGYVAGWHPEPKAVVAAGERIAKAARAMIAAVVGAREGQAAA